MHVLLTHVGPSGDDGLEHRCIHRYKPTVLWGSYIRGEHHFLLLYLRIGGQQDVRTDTLSTVESNKDYRLSVRDKCSNLRC